MADPINILSLYSGSGMHDEAVCAALRVLGFAPRVLGYVEREASAAAWLLGRMEAAAVESAPVWCGDLADLDARPLRGWVDLVVASPPCKPYSSSGKRLGNADERSHGDGDGPLPHTVRIIDECRPAVVWFENVPEWVTGGHFRGFGEELCRLGYDIAPPIFLAAADVGAPHERERVFILCRLADAGGSSVFASTAGLAIRSRGGVAASTGGELGNAKRQGPNVSDAERGGPGARWRWDGPAQRRGGMADSERAGSQGRRTSASRNGRADAEQGGDGVADSGRNGRSGDERRPRRGIKPVAAYSGEDLGDAERNGGCDAGRIQEPDEGRAGVGHGRAEIPMFPPGRNDYGRWAALAAGGLDPACMPAVERGFSALADGLAFSNSELLRLGGNGVVPLVAGAAFIAAFRGIQ